MMPEVDMIHLGCTQNYGPIGVRDFLTAPSI